ncbi:cation diffusion facilitator family transporter [Ancylobacter terrae]|uniref:cation diffusion facilitator family transporter n=1 Tax=Ancylobacter sp. sgz301288 TaxID=3342077 RepID=UPI0038587E8D
MAGPASAAAEQRLLRISIAVTIGISALGVAFGLLSGSLSIVFDGVFSAVDAAMSAVALFVARLLMQEGDRRFQYGYWHIEPLVLAFNGSVLMLLCFYAFINAVGGILKGGRELSFDWAIVYAVVVAAIAFGMFVYVRLANRRVNSEFVRLDTQSWLMSALITSALLAAFLIAHAMQGTAYEHLTPYADPVVLAVLTFVLIPVPIRTVRQAVREILIITPAALDRQVRAVMDAVVARHGFTSYASYVSKVGRARFIEIHIVVPPEFPRVGIAALDAVRAEIGEALGGEGPQRWLTIAFTGDTRFI